MGEIKGISQPVNQGQPVQRSQFQLVKSEETGDKIHVNFNYVAERDDRKSIPALQALGFSSTDSAKMGISLADLKNQLKTGGLSPVQKANVEKLMKTENFERYAKSLRKTESGYKNYLGTPDKSEPVISPMGLNAMMSSGLLQTPEPGKFIPIRSSQQPQSGIPSGRVTDNYAEPTTKSLDKTDFQEGRDALGRISVRKPPERSGPFRNTMGSGHEQNIDRKDATEESNDLLGRKK